MKRYGFEQRDIEVRDGINYQTKRVPGYVIFDRIRGINVTIASCNDPADAELVTDALNYFAETQAKRTNHNTVKMTESFLSRDEAARKLTEVGYVTSLSTLATMASRGGGPKFQCFGKRAMYRWSDLIAWAEGRSEHRGGEAA